MLRDNVNIATTMIEAAYRAGAERFLVVSSACVYPHTCNVPTQENEGFLDEPEPTNRGYGWAKRVAELLGKYYAQEYGMKVTIVRPYNSYGREITLISKLRMLFQRSSKEFLTGKIRSKSGDPESRPARFFTLKILPKA